MAAGERRVGRRSEQKRRWDREHAHKPCPSCGAPMARTSSECVACYEAKCRRHQVMIEAMWADGLTIRQIREVAGVPTFGPGPYRKCGYDLPHRYAIRTGSETA